MPTRKLAGLHARLAAADEALRAIRHGEVDAVLGADKKGTQVFSLAGAERSYRVLIECMNEGALILTRKKVILYANQCFARMVGLPLEQVIGSSFRRFLSTPDRLTLRAHLKNAAQSGSKIILLLQIGATTRLPVQISIRPLTGGRPNRLTLGMVVTDLSESRRTEELLRALTHRVVQTQEVEREHLAVELHDRVTQLLCAVLFRSQALVEKLSAHDGPARQEAVKLRAMLGACAEEVERISRDLRPGVMDQLGLIAALHATGKEFANRTGVSLKLAAATLTRPLPAGTELALYRIFHESLRNVEQHARARHVTVSLKVDRAFVRLVIVDDGIGFDAKHHAARRNGQAVLGLVGMRERATAAGGSLTIKSGVRAGTEITVLIPLPAAPKAAA